MGEVNLLSTSTAAKRLGISTRRVNQLCQAEEIGVLLHQKARALTNTDVVKLEQILAGIERKGWPRGESRKKT